MTRNAPLLTLLAVGVLGGGLFATNHLAAPPAGDAVRVAESAAAPGPPAAAPRIGTVPAPGVVGVVPDPAAAAGADRDVAARPDEIAYAGRTEGRPMTVAVVVTGDEAVAYVCDARDEVWLRGTATGGELDLRSADGSATLTGTADADGATGTFTLDGVEWALTAEATDVDAAVAGGRDDVADVADRAGMAY